MRGICQPASSEHLRRLKDVGLVEDERRGSWVFHRRVGDLPAYVRAALDAIAVPVELTARMGATTPAGACVRSEVRSRPAARVPT